MIKYILILLFFMADLDILNAKIFKIRPEHSKISFQLPFMELSTIDGQFQNFYGQFHWDDKRKILSQIEITIDSSSIFTSNKMRDQHLRQKDFFDVQNFPHIHFIFSDQVKMNAESSSISGQLEVKGKKIPVSFKVTYLGQKEDTWQHQSLFFKVTGKISRNRIGILWNKTLDNRGHLIGDKVSIISLIQAQALDDQTPVANLKIPDTPQMRYQEKLMRGEVERKESKQTQRNVSDYKAIEEEVSPTKIMKKQTEISRPYERINPPFWAMFIVGITGFIGVSSLPFVFYPIYKKLLVESQRKSFWFKLLSMEVLLPVVSFLYAWAYYKCFFL